MGDRGACVCGVGCAGFSGELNTAQSSAGEGGATLAGATSGSKKLSRLFGGLAAAVGAGTVTRLLS